MKLLVPAAAACALLAGCAGTMPTIGDPGAKTVATGSAGGANSQNANKQLERCDRPLGTVAFHEETGGPWFNTFTSTTGQASTLPLLRLIAQQSGCFVIVERGRAFEDMKRERALMNEGEMRQTSNFRKGQMVAADYTVTPSVTFSEKGTGGAGAFLGGLLGPVGSIVGGAMKSNEAATMLIMTDNRSGVQLAASEGSAKNWDFSAFAGFVGGGAAGARGWTNTPQGKVLAAAFMDAHNGLVKAVREYKAQQVEGGLGNGGKLKAGD